MGERAAVDKILATGMIFGGGLRRAFSDELTRVTATSAAGLFSSGRAAIAAGLRALALPAGGEVIVQTYACEAIVQAIRSTGLSPVFCDIGEGWVADPDSVARVRTPRTVALVLAPPFGFLSSAAPFRALGLPILHDLCQASVAALGQAPVEARGDLVALSFHPTKYLCAGGGGALLDPSGRFAEALKEQERATSEMAPFSDVQAAIGLAQLARLETFEKRRSALAVHYLDAVADSASERLKANRDVAWGQMMRLPFELRRGAPDQAIAHHATLGIAARQGVDQLLHRLDAQSDAAYPQAIRAFARTISFPFYPALGDEDATRVAAALKVLP